MARVLITGANGHIGANVAREALQRGHSVVAMVRKGADMRGLDGLKIEVRHADVQDRDAVLKAAEGCEAVIHLAAVYKLWARNIDEIVAPSIEGTRNVFDAAKTHQMKRFVHCSSAATIGPARSAAEPRTRADWHDDARNPYYVAKIRAEREAWRLSEELGIAMIALCPSTVLGPHDYRITPSTGYLRDLINGDNSTYNGGANYVDVREVAMVHVMALEQGTAGQRYLVGGENLMVPELGKIIQALTGMQPSHLGLPRGLAMAGASVLELGARITGKPPAYDPTILHELAGNINFIDCTETYETFGYQPRLGRESVAACIDWLLEIGAFKPEVAAKIRAQRAG